MKKQLLSAFLLLFPFYSLGHTHSHSHSEHCTVCDKHGHTNHDHSHHNHNHHEHAKHKHTDDKDDEDLKKQPKKQKVETREQRMIHSSNLCGPARPAVSQPAYNKSISNKPAIYSECDGDYYKEACVGLLCIAACLIYLQIYVYA